MIALALRKHELAGFSRTNPNIPVADLRQGSHGAGVERYGPVTRFGLASSDRDDSVKEIDVLPPKMLQFDTAACGVRGKNGSAIRDEPFVFGRGSLKQKRLLIGSQHLCKRSVG